MLLTDLIPHLENVIPYSYNDIQNIEYENILNIFLQKSAPTKHPKLIHMSGIPGAGKTTYYKTHSFEPHVFVGFDDIMEAIPSYQKDVLQKGCVAAFQVWEIPARVLGYELLRRAVEAKKTIFFDHGGTNPAHLDLMKNIRQFGYTTEMHYIYCPLDVALQRALDREKKTHRHTPPQMIMERFEKIKPMLNEYQKIADHFYLVDPSEPAFNICRNKAS